MRSSVHVNPCVLKVDSIWRFPPFTTFSDVHCVLHSLTVPGNLEVEHRLQPSFQNIISVIVGQLLGSLSICHGDLSRADRTGVLENILHL